MNLHEEHMRPVIVTTSWDDGHLLDLRTAELLRSCGLTGTFYVSIRSRRTQLSVSQLRELESMGVEIGSHTTSGKAPSFDFPCLQADQIDCKRSSEVLVCEAQSVSEYNVGITSCNVLRRDPP